MGEIEMRRKRSSDPSANFSRFVVGELIGGRWKEPIIDLAGRQHVLSENAHWRAAETGTAVDAQAAEFADETLRRTLALLGLLPWRKPRAPHRVTGMEVRA